MEHTHLNKCTCANGKWTIPRYKWSPCYQIAHDCILEYGVWCWSTFENSNELENQGTLLITLFFLFFSLLFFDSHFFFLPFYFLFLFFVPLNSRQHSTLLEAPPPCLDTCSSSSKRGFIYTFCSENLLSHPENTWNLLGLLHTKSWMFLASLGGLQKLL
jgi:hypothetical protein